ncbi:hypothetical protein CK203_092200 [Vitis vinifera]|uniref:Reverse transcriptase domain-containing protein n=1 Tax=Vitis vinifera TaxID=29760 RepID=A0A438F2E4_VITVI|nr:hypothetical protein CK203_092200 [Vitis vinifera]
MANARRRGNFISSLTVRGVRLDKEEELKEGIRSYFKSMFEETPVRRPAVDSGFFKTLDLLDNETLEGPFSEEEKAGASDVQDFRLVSLVGRLYKIIAKVLANRLKRVMGKVVSNSQNAFVAGLVCKWDIEKAYDHVNWSFLLSVLEKMGFGPKCSLIARAEEKGFIRGFKVMGRSGEGIYVSHLLFADDTLLFCEDNRDQLEFWKKMALEIPLERESFWRKVIVGKFGEEEGGWTIRKWLTFEGDKEVEAGVGRCTLEDLSKIRN